VVGLLAGIAGGVALALNIDVVVPALERVLGLQFLAKDVYYISDLPSDLHWSDVVDHRQRVLRADPAGDAVSELEGLAHATGEALRHE
jgi:hypothetical protein